ncbi:MAG TPA: bifunctional 5,10-methylenetetrahydrofolate dehydrogenase/5,10-methenyltetrahydrofolate cyclohydrolase [Streptosporangiaceae bacterium]|nr:bifunctional 5,10-methylenetetrahydrofolate dehydrogenase/5,10-methenyltetrahydrofolate cyclohydrolase [Streptosporangiaceae bacterium]
MTQLIDGKAIAAAVGEQVRAQVAALAAAGVTPRLAVVIATADDGAAWYVRSINRAAARLGVGCAVHELAPDAREQTITSLLASLAEDDQVHGIVCQTPLPAGVRIERVAQQIPPAKDVDGANPQSLGMLAAGLPDAYPPATAAAVVEILAQAGTALEGRRAVVVGRSTVVGKPVALLLLARNATLTICHSRTEDLASVCREGDVLVAAAGKPALIGAGHVRPGAVVIDVGISASADGSLVGDVDTQAVTGIAAAITPVPGGVGPVTTMLLMRQTAHAAGVLAGLTS